MPRLPRASLNNWPDAVALRLLRDALHRLPSGGRVFVFEPAPIPVGEVWNEFHLLPTLLRCRSFRSPEFYLNELRDYPCEVDLQWIHLELPHYLIIATKT